VSCCCCCCWLVGGYVGIARVVNAPHIESNRRLQAADVSSRLGGGSPRKLRSQITQSYCHVVTNQPAFGWLVLVGDRG
jgi:hypothetical protein